MKFLKKSQINFRNVKDNSVAIQIDGEVTLDSPNSVLIPRGLTSERPVSSVTGDIKGMLRYNTTTNEVEVYQGQSGRATWRSLRYKESTQIIRQELGAGDEIEVFFGPLDPAPPLPSLIDDKSTWSGHNLLVIVENVIQLFAEPGKYGNYTILQSPCRVTGTVISFADDESISSADTNIVNFVDRGFWSGQIINITNPSNPSNSGSFEIIQVTSNKLTLDPVVPGQQLANQPAGSTVTVVGLSSPTGPGAGLEYTNGGYYIKFDSPVPIGTVDPKYVTVIHGLDR
jgi:hypothetical protein